MLNNSITPNVQYFGEEKKFIPYTVVCYSMESLKAEYNFVKISKKKKKNHRNKS